MPAFFPNSLFVATAAMLDPTPLLSEWQQVVLEIEAMESISGENPHVSVVNSHEYPSLAARLEEIEGNLKILGTLGYRSLLIQNNLTTPTSILDVSAEYVACEGKLLGPISDTCSMGVSGAGGLDTGSPALSTWYHVYVIYAPATDTTELIFSTSSVRPSMPTGYTKARRVGAVYRNSSGQFLRFSQQDNLCVYNGDDTNANLRVLSLGKNTSFTNVPATGAVPPTARMAVLHVMSTVGGGRTVSAYILAGGVTAGAGQNGILVLNGVTIDTRNSGVLVRLASSNFQYKFAGTATGSEGVSAEVQGYFDQI